ncbi:universal stress protein [Aquimarina algicola]|uniref:Universal stress protein n=1 Tax=Aquimarina algicola TaxID=2589995 RepID=A0A504JLY1_9FLAO|nr:universal stress protein [Aquimarina algicola]TPN87470.1 universal stress protein [Aquimarina algicola]
MKKILVPTDFSNNAYNALYYATRLFKNEKCQFYILNTYDVEVAVLAGIIEMKQGDQELRKESEEKLEETYHTIIRDTEDFEHRFECISSSERLIDTIEQTVKEKKIELIVMGTKGATGAKGFLMGSNTSNIIQKIKCCPVLAVPDEFYFEDPEDVPYSK